MNWDKAKTIILKNKEVQNELKMNETEYKIIEEIIMARKEKNLTQKDLAKLIGTKQSNISRLESGNYNPTIEFLNRVAVAVGKELKVSIA
ncbi:MAG: helix-turn-helix transcriptional regulator [Treponema sp.]|nr:helix-turn-helix transcriptional regulator [Treponema sp.]